MSGAWEETEMQRAFHVAIADDWEMSLGLGEYEAATRGLAWEPGDFIRATTADGIQGVLDAKYGDLTLPLLLVCIDTDALAASGVEVDHEAGSTTVRIDGPLPSGDPGVIREIIPLRRDEQRWMAPVDLGD
jgi:glutathione S-transferase